MQPVQGPPLVYTHGEAVDEAEGQANGEDGTKGGDEAPVGKSDKQENHGKGDADHGGEGGQDGAHLGREGGREGGKEDEFHPRNKEEKNRSLQSVRHPFLPPSLPPFLPTASWITAAGPSRWSVRAREGSTASRTSRAVSIQV